MEPAKQEEIVIAVEAKPQKDQKVNASKRKRLDSEESMGSLKDFIVDDEEVTEDESSDDSVDTSDSETSLEEVIEEIVEEEPKPKKKKLLEDPDTIQLMIEEAKKFAGDVSSGTVVGGRVLRSRAPEKIEARKPKDHYYERFGRDEEERLMEKFTKKDILMFLSNLKDEHQEAYEAATHEAWPKLHVRMSLEHIRSEYQKVKDFLNLPDSEDESEDIEELDEDDADSFEDSTEEDEE
jgi:hypothetical protein